MFLNLLLPYNIFLVWKQSNLRLSVYNSSYLFEYSADMVISSCCNYYQPQLCVGLRGMVFGEVKQSTI